MAIPLEPRGLCDLLEFGRPRWSREYKFPAPALSREFQAQKRRPLPFKNIQICSGRIRGYELDRCPTVAGKLPQELNTIRLLLLIETIHAKVSGTVGN